MATNKNPFKPDYEDERLKEVEKQRDDDLKSNQDLQQELLTKTDNTYNGLNANLEAQTKESEKALEEQTNFSIQQMEQKKEQVDKDLATEQSAAYADYQKESNKYGVNAERRAASGLERTGYSETSQTRMYQAYQNRVAVARSSAETAKQNYELGMQQARMQHSVALAEIRTQAYQQQLELSIQGLNARNKILLDFANREQTIKTNANTRWQEVLAQINREIDMKEEARQFDEQYGVLPGVNALAGAVGVGNEERGTKSQAVQYLIEYGASKELAEAVMGPHEWKAAKQRNDSSALGETYEEYVDLYLKKSVSPRTWALLVADGVVN